MSDTIQLGDIEIELTRKAVKHAHLSVHPPHGRVSLVAPAGTRLEVARAFAITKLAWIREQRSQLRAQAREAPRRFVQRETHYLWGRRHLLAINLADVKPMVSVDHRRITVTIRPGTSAARRAEVMHDWQKSLLHGVVPALARGDHRRVGARRDRVRLHARPAGAHQLGPAAQAGVPDRPGALPKLRWRAEDRCGHRRIGGDRADPYAPGVAGPGAAADSGA